MKKFLSFVLVLVMVMSLSVTAFAEGEQSGTTTLTVEVPNPSYTIHIPANTTLEYGNTELQEFGIVSVSDVANTRFVDVAVNRTNLINKEDSTDEIALKIFYRWEGYSFADVDGIKAFGVYSLGEYQPVYMAAKVEDWYGATPGATYQAVITFQFTVIN